MDEQKKQFANVYVRNLDPGVTEEELRELFTQYGAITFAVLQFDSEGKSQGLGFVNFEDDSNASKAVEALDNSEHKGRRLYVARAQQEPVVEDGIEYWASQPASLDGVLGADFFHKILSP